MDAILELFGSVLDNKYVQFGALVMFVVTAGINLFGNPKPGTTLAKVVSFLERFLSFADRNGRLSLPFGQGERKEALVEEEASLAEDENK